MSNCGLDQIGGTLVRVMNRPLYKECLMHRTSVQKRAFGALAVLGLAAVLAGPASAVTPIPIIQPPLQKATHFNRGPYPVAGLAAKPVKPIPVKVAAVAIDPFTPGPSAVADLESVKPGPIGPPIVVPRPTNRKPVPPVPRVPPYLPSPTG
jgi:hypothetical protein